MATDAMVERQIDAGRQLLCQLAENGFDVIAACWLKVDEGSFWRLYVASPLVDREGPLAAYREVQRILRSSGKGTLTTSDIRLIGENHPVTQDALSLYTRHSGIATRFPRAVFGGIPAEEMYVYSLPMEMEEDEVGLLTQGEKDRPELPGSEQDAEEDPFQLGGEGDTGIGEEVEDDELSMPPEAGSAATK